MRGSLRAGAVFCAVISLTASSFATAAAASPREVEQSIVEFANSDMSVIVLAPSASVTDKNSYDPGRAIAVLRAGKDTGRTGLALPMSSPYPNCTYVNRYPSGVARTTGWAPNKPHATIDTEFSGTVYAHNNAIGGVDRMCIDTYSFVKWLGSDPYYANQIGLTDTFVGDTILFGGLQLPNGGAWWSPISNGASFSPPLDSNQWQQSHYIYDLEMTTGFGSPGFTGYHETAASTVELGTNWFYSTARYDF